MSALSDLAHKVAGGGPVSDEDARQLAATTDLVTVGMVAAEARRVHAGDGVTFVRVAETEHHATLPLDGWPSAARELRIVDTPPSSREAVAIVRALVSTAGDRPVTGFSLVQLWALAGDAVGLEKLARDLVRAGLAAIADVPIDRLPQPREALAAVTAAGLAAPVARWDAVPADPVAALAQVRDLQTQTKALRAFAPLPRQSDPGAESGPPQTGYDGVKLVALARVMLHNVQAVQVDWARHGPKLAQVALLFGASDLDRVSPSDEAPLGHRRAPLEEVERNISAAFLKSLERDGRFERVVR